MNVPHLPVLRLGRSYESLDKLEVKDHRTGELQGGRLDDQCGYSAQGFPALGEARAALKKFTVPQLIELSAKGGRVFPERELPLGDKGHTQTADEYV
jgi:hypothetical protein